MKTIKKNVYYCEYCNKHGLSAGSMSKHEKHCTANPDRECRLCGNSINVGEVAKKLSSRFKLVDHPEENIHKFITIKVEWIGEKITMDELDDLSECCPICKLAIMRQSKLTHWVFSDTELRFHYLEELKDFWADKNREEQEREEMREMYY